MNVRWPEEVDQILYMQLRIASLAVSQVNSKKSDKYYVNNATVLDLVFKHKNTGLVLQMGLLQR